MSTPKPGQSDEPSESEAVTIIRYPNRRLYDRSQAKYVTLQDVEDTVRRGRTVVVRDSKTGEDLTRSVLTQLLLERHPERMDLFPTSLLHLMIRANEVMLGVIRDSVRQSLLYIEMFQRMAPFNPLGVPQEWLRTFLPGLPLQGPPENQAPRGTEADLDALLRRIGDLERRLAEVDAAAGDAGPATTSRKRKPGQEG
jgi:polyhydroxyalkanoate synthesis repressor PhaR